jgi:hypothetical protein
MSDLNRTADGRKLWPEPGDPGYKPGSTLPLHPFQRELLRDHFNGTHEDCRTRTRSDATAEPISV